MSLDRRARLAVLVSVLLAVGTVAVFWPLRESRFTNYDDTFYVQKNPRVQQGLSWSGIAWALTSTEHSNWHPLTWLSLQLDAEIHGLDAGGYHLTNVLLHAASTALVFLVFWKMTGAAAPSALVAALFALHPLHVESVAWITERKDVLSTLFWMLTLAAYARYAERPNGPRLALVALALALGLAAKPMLVTLPFVLLLLDFWPLSRSSAPGRGWPLWREKLPLFALSAAACVMTLIAQSRGGAIRADIPFATRAANALVAYVTYIGQMLWPPNLAVLYPYEELSWTDWRVWAAAAFLAAATLLAIAQRRRRPFLLVGWLWYLGTLVPVIGLVQVGEQPHADRYTYVPLVGLFVAVAWTLAELARRGAWSRRLVAIGSAVAVILCGLLTREQLRSWRDAETLWTHAIRVTGPNPSAHFGLASFYRDEGRLERAVEEFRRALELNPQMRLFARFNAGWCLLLLGRIDEADAEFTPILDTTADDPDEHLQLALRARELNDSALAFAHFARALRARPENGPAHLGLALELLDVGQHAAARRHLAEAARCDPHLRDRRDFEHARRELQMGVTGPTRNLSRRDIRQ